MDTTQNPSKDIIIICTKETLYTPCMLHDTRATDAVQMRIFVSMLNKLGLPRIYADEIFDNVHLQYDIRKPVFEDYYLMKILGLPFCFESRPCPF